MNMTRRSFAAGAFASAGVAFAGCARRDEGFERFEKGKGGGSPGTARPTRVGEPHPAWMPGHFQIHMIYTGVAESQFLIFPDGTSLLIDCGDHPACRGTAGSGSRDTFCA